MDAGRQAILDAAGELLADQGYAGCGVAAVAARAGIATGTVYQHFASKSELVVELFRAVVGHEVEAVTTASRFGDPIGRVVAVVETFATRALKSPRLAYALLAEPVDAPVEAERLVFRRAFRDTTAARVADAIAAGVIPAQDPQTTAAAIVGAVTEVLIGPLTMNDELDPVPTLITFTVRALGGCDASNT